MKLATGRVKNRNDLNQYAQVTLSAESAASTVKRFEWLVDPQQTVVVNPDGSPLQHSRAWQAACESGVYYALRKAQLHTEGWHIVIHKIEGRISATDTSAFAIAASAALGNIIGKEIPYVDAKWEIVNGEQ